MADFIKPSHTQSSDEIVSALNSKIAAIATLSLNDGTWTNVPIGTVAFDPASNQFKRKTAEDTWSTIEISLGIGSSLTIGTLNVNSVTLLATPTSNNQTLTAASYKLLTDDVAFLKASTIELQTGTSGTDFNITTGAPSGEDLSSSSITKVINLPSASETARGVVTTGTQTIGGIKTFASGSIQLGNSATAANNWHITTENNDGSLRILSGNHGSGIEKIRIDSEGKLGLGTGTPTSTLHIKGIDAGIKLEDSTGGSTGSVSLSATSSTLFVDATTRISLNTQLVGTTGNLSIGASSWPYKLNVNRGASDGILAEFKRDGGTSLYVTNTTTKSCITTDTSSSTAIELNESGDYLAAWTNGSERVRVTNTGAVGIGTSTPEQALDVSGGIQSRSKLNIKSSPPYVGLIDQNSAAATNSAFLYADQGTFYLLRGVKGSETWTHNNTNIWPLQIDLNTNEARLGGNLFVVNSASKLGIGTSSPNEKLSIQSSAGVAAGISLRGNNNTTAGEVVVSQGGDGNAYLWNRSSSGLYLGTSNTTRVCIDAQGRLAVNTTPFAWNTSLTNATLDASGGLGMMVYAGNTYIGQNMYWNSSNQWIRKAAGSSSLYVIGGDGSHLWYSAPSGAANSAFSYTQTLSLNSSGDLTATRNIAASGSISASGNIYGSAGLGLSGGITCGNELIMQGSSPTIYLRDSDHRSSMIHCNSNLLYFLRGSGANSTTWTATLGYWPLVINLENNDVTVGGDLWYPRIERAGGNSQVVHVTSAGRLFGPTSSIRYKKDVETIEESYADKILQLRPVLYKSKKPTDEYEPEHYSWYGLIAEEVAQIEPRLTYESYSDDDWEIKVDEITKQTTRTLKAGAKRRPEGVNYDKLGVLLIDVVRRQRDKIESLEKRLSALEALINKR